MSHYGFPDAQSALFDLLSDVYDDAIQIADLERDFPWQVGLEAVYRLGFERGQEA